MRYNDYQIKDLNTYTSCMQKSVLDKMYFINKIFDSFSNIIDFGCANGELIKALQVLFNEYRYIGYDISEEMLAAARTNVPTAEFYSNWNEIHVEYRETLLNISSTLHEIYSYSTKTEIDEFWERVFESGFKYIAIRDMMLSDVDLTGIDSDQHRLVIEDENYADKLNDYESVWGKISTQHDLVH